MPRLNWNWIFLTLTTTFKGLIRQERSFEGYFKEISRNFHQFFRIIVWFIRRSRKQLHSLRSCFSYTSTTFSKFIYRESQHVYIPFTTHTTLPTLVLMYNCCSISDGKVLCNWWKCCLMFLNLYDAMASITQHQCISHWHRIGYIVGTLFQHVLTSNFSFSTTVTLHFLEIAIHPLPRANL